MFPGNFRDHLCARVKAGFGREKAEELTSAYDQARSRLQKEVYEYIRTKEPNLTDHGPAHLSHVEDNVVALLCEDNAIAALSGIELYCLGMLVLFHDAGNIYGRANHQRKIAPVFDRIRGTGAAVRREKTLVVRAARAHTGTAQDGSHDTLKELGNKENLQGKPVRLRELAAILRFADELAEGPQRTSDFMQAERLHAEESRLFHEYAANTHILIDRSMGRVVVTYEVDIDEIGDHRTREEHLAAVLKFTYRRLVKLDQERQYARHYSELLSPFAATEASFNFHCAGEVLDIDILPLTLTDAIVVPGTQTVDVSTIDPAYAVEQLVPKLLSADCGGRQT